VFPERKQIKLARLITRDYVLDPKDPLSDAPTLSQDRLKEIMQGRMARAQARLDEARATVTEAQAYAVKCETFLNQATAAFHKQFPPMHEMDAIKEHLRRSMQHRAEAVGRPDLYRDGTLAPSPLDSRLSGRDNRGHRVPQLAR
jgi:hypothetical protein